MFLDSYHYVLNRTKRNFSSDHLTEFRKLGEPATETIDQKLECNRKMSKLKERLCSKEEIANTNIKKHKLDEFDF